MQYKEQLNELRRVLLKRKYPSAFPDNPLPFLMEESGTDDAEWARLQSLIIEHTPEIADALEYENFTGKRYIPAESEDDDAEDSIFESASGRSASRKKRAQPTAAELRKLEEKAAARAAEHRDQALRAAMRRIAAADAADDDATNGGAAAHAEAQASSAEPEADPLESFTEEQLAEVDDQIDAILHRLGLPSYADMSFTAPDEGTEVDLYYIDPAYGAWQVPAQFALLDTPRQFFYRVKEEATRVADDVRELVAHVQQHADCVWSLLQGPADLPNEVRTSLLSPQEPQLGCTNLWPSSHRLKAQKRATLLQLHK